LDLTGLIDLHIHTAPDVRPRSVDDIEAASAAADAGMRAILIKSHVTCTADRAAIAQKVVGGRVRVLGGLALDDEVGGFNPVAVEAALKLGAAQIWMPTFSAKGRGDRGLAIWDADQRMLPVVEEILRLIAGARVILGTGHLSVPEIVALVGSARSAGVERVLVTHPDSTIVQMPAHTQSDLARQGAWFERCFVGTKEAAGLSLSQVAAVIRDVGVETTVLSTDFGQAHNPPPVEGLRAYLDGLLAEGFSESELRRMAGENPAALIA
jgi:hypothetical protein